MKRVLCTILLFVTTVFTVHATNWEDAKWIWLEDDGSANSWTAFRKTVEINEIPKEVIAKIAVDSKFWLWVNGKMILFEGGVSRGPSQAGEWNRKEKITPSNSWYESINIAPYLIAGKNTIAILVWYWGRETHKGTHISSGKGGLLFSCQVGNQNIISNAGWKVKKHSGYNDNVEPASTSLTQFPVKFNGDSDMKDWSTMAWYSSDFDDTSWKLATEKGSAGDAPWYNLIENYVPRLINHGLENYTNHSQLKFPFVSDGKTITCVLPFNKQITPYLEIESKANDTIFITTDNKLNKITATYITREGNQAFESFSWMNGHEIKYTIPAGVKVKALKYRWMSVGEMAGDFRVDDAFYERLWWMGRNTLFVCARDNFMDCPDRERALWIGDVADQTGYIFYAMDNAGRVLLKKAILTTINFSENKVIGALGPLRVRELPGQSLQFIAQVVWPYYLNTGDKELLLQAYPYVYNYLALFPMQEDGLPEYRRGKSPDSWDWVDWGVKETIDSKPIQSALYYMALSAAKKIAEVVGKNADVNWYNERMKAMEVAYNKVFWKDGFYSSDVSKFKDDRANAIAIVSGLAKPEDYNKIVDSVLIPNRFSSPHFEWIVEDAMCKAGRYADALYRMKYQYNSQVENKKLSTLYENFPNGGSYNHAWNAPNTILSKHIAGITPTAIGWSEFEIMPNLEHFMSLEETVPTVKGNIDVKIQKTEAAYQLTLHSPQSTAATIGIPKSGGKISAITMNGSVVWENGKSAAKIEGVSFSGETEKYINFKVPSGAWNIRAEYKK